MRYLALATDYDGTLASEGLVDGPTLEALRNLRATGRRLILVTGRALTDLKRIFPGLDLFDFVVAENGALLYRPSDGTKTLAAKKIPRAFIEDLKRRGVNPLDDSEVIVATWEPNENLVLSAIRELGLELDVVFNKGAVMILPAGVNKGTGLSAALKELQLSVHNVVGVGDAENDHAFLQLCECSVAVANALPSIAEHADLVTQADDGAGVVELAHRLTADDLDSVLPRLSRNRICFGTDGRGSPIGMHPFASNLMIAGPSGTGKATLASGILERLVECGYQVCLFDPAGQYEGFPGLIETGGSGRPPHPDEVVKILQEPNHSVSVNLLGMPLEVRPTFLAHLLPLLQGLREHYGRPHQLVIDESQQLLPKDPGLPSWDSVQGVIFITIEPDNVALAPLRSVDLLVATGTKAERTIERFAKAIGVRAPQKVSPLNEGEALLWNCRERTAPIPFQPQQGSKLVPRHCL